MTENTERTVLIIDDETANIKILSDHLKNDVKVIFATGGEEGISLAHQNHPDLVLLDIMMPEMDGYEVCKRLKANPKTKTIPIIFVTAMDHEEDQAAGLELGAVDYITKPFNPDIIKAKVISHIEQAAILAAAASGTKEPTAEKRKNFGRRAADRTESGSGSAVSDRRRAADRTPATDSETGSGGKKGVMGFLAVLVLAAAGGGAYWYMTQQEKAVPVSGNPNWINEAKCAAIPDRPWWKNTTHAVLVKYVDRKHDGDWRPYIAKWTEQRDKLSGIAERGKAAVMPNGVRLAGRDLEEYVEDVAKRVKILKCLASADPKNR